MRRLLILLLIPFLMGSAPTRLHTYTSGTTIEASKVTANEDAIFNYLTAGVDTYYALSIENADVSNSAGISDGKLDLATIAQAIAFNGTTTFSGTTITSLGTVTSGVITAIDINSGGIDNTVIGGTTPNFIRGTTIKGTDVKALSTLQIATGVEATVIVDEDSMSGDSATALSTQQSIKAYFDSNPPLSNVIFSWHGGVLGTTNIFHLYKGTSTEPVMSTSTPEYTMWAVFGNTYRTILTSQYVHLTNTESVTIHANIWANTVEADEETYLKVTIGSATAQEVKSTTSQTPTWYEGSTPIDVSGLTAGTKYTITLELKNEKNTDNAYLGGIVLIGS